MLRSVNSFLGLCSRSLWVFCCLSPGSWSWACSNPEHKKKMGKVATFDKWVCKKLVIKNIMHRISAATQIMLAKQQLSAGTAWRSVILPGGWGRIPKTKQVLKFNSPTLNFKIGFFILQMDLQTHVLFYRSSETDKWSLPSTSQFNNLILFKTFLCSPQHRRNASANIQSTLHGPHLVSGSLVHVTTSLCFQSRIAKARDESCAV